MAAYKIGLILASLLGYQLIVAKSTYHKDGRLGVAQILSTYQDQNYTLASTEAGLLPLYSRWRTIDTWGLNDQWIAHNGTITEQYFEAIQPEVIMFHALCSPIVECNDTDWPWHETVKTSMHFAEKNGYILAAVFGETPYNTHYYYVKPNFEDSDKIVTEIRNLPYFWFSSGQLAVNFAQLTKRTASGKNSTN